MIKYLLILFITVAAFEASAIDMQQIRFKNEATDTTLINQILSEVQAKKLRSPGEIALAVAEEFMDKPYVAKTLEGEPEMLTVNLDELDCTTFVEMVIAMTLTLDERRNSWRDYVYNLERVRYRNGTLNGYPSRLHYNSDWAADNIHRGNFTDATPTFPKYTYMTRTLDFMSENADKYTALADSANLAGIKNVERGYRSHRFPYIKTVDVANKDVRSEFRNGDIVGFVSNIKNLDVSHLGIIKMVNGEPYVIHASSSAGKVVITDKPLVEFLKKNRQFLGVRVYRITN
ncbi:MAG: DUF1460 domain-containing protein [Bacteroidales bacterium]|nr:DUF1460 domain-containing protein [Bacteroidales bacterium]